MSRTISPLVSIIIVSYNTKEFLQQCLSSIKANRQSLSRKEEIEQEVIVVDNASCDGSPTMIKAEFPQVKLIQNQRNLGFAAANNQALKIAQGDYLFLLNSDTRASPQAIDQLIQLLEAHPDIGIASCQLVNPDQSLQPQGGFLPRLTNIFAWMLFLDDLPVIKSFTSAYHLSDKNKFNQTLYLGWVSGTAMMIKRQVINTIGLLDNHLFMYGEDVDFCWRAQKQGFKIALTPRAKITHYQHGSLAGESRFARIQEFKALKYLFQKHQPAWKMPLLRFALISGALLRLLIFGIIKARPDSYETYSQSLKAI